MRGEQHRAGQHPGRIERSGAGRNVSGRDQMRREQQYRQAGSRLQYQHNRPRPAMRKPIAHDKPSHFWSRKPHYYGYRVTSIPSHYVRKTHWGVDYYFVDDIWYRRRAGVYYVCRPPFGVVFAPKSAHFHAVALNFAFYANYYHLSTTMSEMSRTIAEQNRQIAENNRILAEQNEAIALNSVQANRSAILANELGLVQSYASAASNYYYDDGVFYAQNASGDYYTIIPPVGALVQTLPEDYDLVVLSDGNEYYRVDDTIFRTTVIEGTVYFEVLGQVVE